MPQNSFGLLHPKASKVGFFALLLYPNQQLEPSPESSLLLLCYFVGQLRPACTINITVLIHFVSFDSTTLVLVATDYPNCFH